MKREFRAWAASMKYKPDKERFLAGRYFFDSDNDVACLIALFKTRQEAREAIRTRRSWFTTGYPIRVVVTVEEETR